MRLRRVRVNGLCLTIRVSTPRDRETVLGARNRTPHKRLCPDANLLQIVPSLPVVKKGHIVDDRRLSAGVPGTPRKNERAGG